MFSFCPNSIRLLSKRAWDRRFLSLFFFWRGASDSCQSVGTKLSPHHFCISSLHANTLISIRCCSGQPGSHDISQVKESTEQLCSAQEKLQLLVVSYPWWWCHTHHHVTLRTGTGPWWLHLRLKNYKSLFTSVWNVRNNVEHVTTGQNCQKQNTN